MNDERSISMTTRELGHVRQSHLVSRLRYDFLCLVVRMVSSTVADLGFCMLDLASPNRKLGGKDILIKLQKEHNFCCHVNVSFFIFGTVDKNRILLTFDCSQYIVLA